MTKMTETSEKIEIDDASEAGDISEISEAETDSMYRFDLLRKCGTNHACRRMQLHE